MKKMKFLSGINAAFALAAVALATTFTSCEKEEFNVNVDPINARAEVKANVIVIEDGVSRIMGDNEGSVTYNPGNTFTGNPTLAAQAVTITATYKDVSATLVVNIPALEAGQTAYFTPTIVLTKNTPVVPETPTEIVVKSDTITVKQDSNPKVVNEDNTTDYWYSTTVTWTKKSGEKIVAKDIKTDKMEELAIVYGFIGSLEETYNETTMEEEINVYSHSRTTVKVSYTITTKTYQVWAEEVEVTRAVGDKKLLAEITTETYDSSFSQEPNLQIPGHNHAPAGHGHGHGHGGDNAGGGIVIAD